MYGLLISISHRSTRRLDRNFVKAYSDLQIANAQLESSEKQFRTLAEALPQIIWITTSDGANIYFNRQWTGYTGLTFEETSGHRWTTPFHPEDRERAWNAWRTAVATDGTYSLECRMRRADGVYRWFLIRGISLHDEKGKITNWFGTCTDIEEIKQAQIALSLAESRAIHAREEAIATISHDLNNPLTAIQLNVQSINTMSVFGSELSKRNLTLIEKASRQMTNLIQNLLDYSKIESNHFKVEKKAEDVASVLDEVFSIFEPFANNKSIRLTREVDPQLSTIFCEKQRIVRVLSNLLSNALKFTPPGGTVSVEVEAQNDSTLFSVRDTGPGIKSERLSHVFERYWQAEETAHKGSGLGLAIAKGFVEAHGGHIWAESKEGQGSVFFFSLPNASTAPTTRENESAKLAS